MLLSTESCSTFQPQSRVPDRQFNPVGPLVDLYPAGNPVSTSEFRFLSKLEGEGKSVEAGPEGGGDTDSEKCRGLTRGIPRFASPAQRVFLRSMHPEE
jgi:hypothetical protein